MITPEVRRARAGSIEVAVATLATDRALLLLGVPGTAKTWVSEHLAAAISGDSTLLVQGTAGTAEEAVRYGWNYARLLAEGPSRDGAGAEPGDAGDGATAQIARVEELTRMPVRRAGRADHRSCPRRRCRCRSWATEVQAVRASTSSPPPTTATAA